VRSTGVAKRLFFMFLFQSPSISPLSQIKPQPPIRKGKLQETYSSPFIVKKTPFCAFYSPYCTKKSHF
ncbi:MAG: hypothetical protein SPF44_05420, partial [Sodaliphilus sp.]|nr:hypothetical protein [Sodaliphilus sp.]